MTHKRICILLCLLISCLPTTLGMQVLATSLDTQENYRYDEDNKNFWDSISLAVLEEEPPVKPISCFDVNDTGHVVLGFRGNNRNTISVYSKDGVFQYGYTFFCYGSYYVFWKQDSICIYFVRGNTVVTVDQTGRCLDICDAEEVAIDSNILKNIKSSVKQIGEIKYCLENDMIIGKEYGRLRILTPDGRGYVFYDATELHNTRVITVITAVALFTFIATFYVVKRLFLSH